MSQFLIIGANQKKNFIKKDNYDDKKVKYFLLEEPFPENTSIWQNQAIQREFFLKKQILQMMKIIFFL